MYEYMHAMYTTHIYLHTLYVNTMYICVIYLLLLYKADFVLDIKQHIGIQWPICRTCTCLAL